MMVDEVDVNGIQRHLGSGRFQILAFLTLGLIYSRGAWHMFGIMFLAGDPGHKCALPLDTDTEVEGNNDVSSPFLSSHPSKLNSSVPYSIDMDKERDSVLPTSLDVNNDRMLAVQGDAGFDVVKSNWTADTCVVSYTTQNGSSVSLAKECPYGWAYGSLFERTVLSEWDLVCKRDFLVELSMTIFMVGAMVGAMVILPLSDRFGRKRVMLGCLFCQACVGTATAFVESYTLFTIFRFIIGMLNIGVGLSSFVLMTEIFPADKRTVMSIAFQVFWAVGVMTVAGFGYWVRHWRKLELLLSLPNVLALPCYWLLPESLPWLVSQKRWTEALSTMKTIAKINRKDINEIIHLLPGQHSDISTSMASHSRTEQPDNAEVNAETETDSMIHIEGGAAGLNETGDNTKRANGVTCHTRYASSDGDRGTASLPCSESEEEKSGQVSSRGEAEQETQHSILDLFRHRQMRLYSCIMFFLFFVSSLGYFGISFSVPVLHGNQFVNLCIMGVVELPANVICVLVSQRVGRRYPSAVFLLLCGVSNIVAIFIPSHLELLKLAFVMVGKFAITAAYSTVYLYSAEIFPTAIRNQAMGMSSVFENIGSVCAPFIVLAAKSIAELPLVLFGVLTIAGGGLTLLLPETHNRPLPQTVQEITTW